MWSVDNCHVVSDGGSRTKCECAQPGHFGLLFVSGLILVNN